MADKDKDATIQRLDELEKRVKVTEDIEQIKQLFWRYINARTLRDSQAELDCFAEDGALNIGDNPVKGKTALAEFIAANETIEGVKVKPVPTEGQFLVHPLITVNVTGQPVNGFSTPCFVTVLPVSHYSGHRQRMISST